MAYQTSLAARDLKSRAHSTTFNRRNIEHDWYPAWNQVFTDITSTLPHVYVYPQHFLWLRPSESLAPPLRAAMLAHLAPDDDFTAEIDDADVALLALADVDDAHLAQLSLEEPIDGDTSFGSAATVAGSEKDLKPDFSFMHLTVAPLSTVRANSAYSNNRAGRKILHECYFGICEVKQAPSRRLSAPDRHAERAELFASAREQLAKYANLYFLATGGLARDKLLLWACVGAFWRWASVSREDVPAWDWSTDSFVDGHITDQFHNMFSEKFELCTPRSDLEINHLIANHFQLRSIHEGENNDEVDVSDDDMNED